MRSYYSKENLQELPQTPGVYQYFDLTGNIIYIGKANNLRKRITSYFQKNHDDQKTQNLVERIQRIKIIRVFNEFEAILLESELIRKHKPKYNLISRDDRHYNYISITKETFPRILLKRKSGDYGPFPSSRIARDILRLVRSITPFCTQNPSIKTPCFYSHINLCNPCPAYINKQSGELFEGLSQTYKQNIHKARILLSGKVDKLKKLLQIEMKNCVKKENFENAAYFRDRIVNLDYLVNNYHTAYEFINNPDLITQTSLKEHKEMLKILNTYYTQLKLLKKIEWYDISNIHGKSAVGSMVTFIEGQPAKQLYRKFRIRFLETPNDVEMLKEVFKRRLKHSEWFYPDLIIVDGGRTQLSAMNKVNDEFNLDLPIIGLAKRFDEIVIYNNKSYLFIKLPNHSPALHLVQRLRDEAHRFAHTYYELLSRKSMLSQSAEYV